jgi:hypothetical protein
LGFLFFFFKGLKNVSVEKLWVAAKYLTGDFQMQGYQGAGLRKSRNQKTHLPPTWDRCFIQLSPSLTSQCKMIFEERCNKPGHMGLSLLKGGHLLLS